MLWYSLEDNRPWCPFSAPWLCGLHQSCSIGRGGGGHQSWIIGGGGHQSWSIGRGGGIRAGALGGGGASELEGHQSWSIWGGGRSMGGGGPKKAQKVCRLVLPDVRAGLGFRGQLIIPNHWGKAFLLDVSGIAVPLLTSAASAPAASLAGAGNASQNVIPKTVKFGGCSSPPPPKCGESTQGRWWGGGVQEGRLGAVQYNYCPVPCLLCGVLGSGAFVWGGGGGLRKYAAVRTGLGFGEETVYIACP